MQQIKQSLYSREVRSVWVSKKRWKALVKRVAALEKQIQSQPLEIISAIYGIRNEQMKKGIKRGERR